MGDTDSAFKMVVSRVSPLLLLLPLATESLLFRAPHSSCTSDSDCAVIPGHTSGVCLRRWGLLCHLSLHSWWHGGSCAYHRCAECHFNRDCRYGEYCSQTKQCLRQLAEVEASSEPTFAIGGGKLSINLKEGLGVGLPARPLEYFRRMKEATTTTASTPSTATTASTSTSTTKSTTATTTTLASTSTTSTTTTSTTITAKEDTKKTGDLVTDSLLKFAILNANQSKLAKLKRQNEQLEQQVRLMTNKYAQLIDRLSIKGIFNDIL